MIFTFPVWVGFAAAAFGILMAGICCIFALAVCVVALVGALMLTGIIFSGVGIAQILGGLPAIGLILLGIGLLALAVSILRTSGNGSGRLCRWKDIAVDYKGNRENL